VVQHRDLPLVRRHDELSALPMGDVTFAAVRVEPPSAIDTPLRLERTGGVIQAGVDDLAVARRRFRAGLPVPFQQQHGEPAATNKRTRYGRSHNAGADHDHVDPFHGNMAMSTSMTYLSCHGMDWIDGDVNGSMGQRNESIFPIR
jgi:hypothetical protein